MPDRRSDPGLRPAVAAGTGTLVFTGARSGTRRTVEVCGEAAACAASRRSEPAVRKVETSSGCGTAADGFVRLGRDSDADATGSDLVTASVDPGSAALWTPWPPRVDAAAWCGDVSVRPASDGVGASGDDVPDFRPVDRFWRLRRRRAALSALREARRSLTVGCDDRLTSGGAGTSTAGSGRWVMCQAPRSVAPGGATSASSEPARPVLLLPVVACGRRRCPVRPIAMPPAMGTEPRRPKRACSRLRRTRPLDRCSGAALRHAGVAPPGGDAAAPLLSAPPAWVPSSAGLEAMMGDLQFLCRHLGCGRGDPGPSHFTGKARSTVQERSRSPLASTRVIAADVRVTWSPSPANPSPEVFANQSNNSLFDVTPRFSVMFGQDMRPGRWWVKWF